MTGACWCALHGRRRPDRLVVALTLEDKEREFTGSARCRYAQSITSSPASPWLASVVAEYGQMRSVTVSRETVLLRTPASPPSASCAHRPARQMITPCASSL
jgi:hypothetical protein